MKSKENVIVFHHDDGDGRMSAAIIKQHYPDAEMIEMSYGFDEDEFIEVYIEQETLYETMYDKIYVVDFSFNEHIMGHLKKLCKEFIWVDHHKSAMEKLSEVWNDTSIKGLRRMDKSGCGLTWEYFHPNLDAPLSVNLVEDFDIWKFKYGEDTKVFAEAVQYWGVDDFYGLLIYPGTQEVIEQGQVLLKQKMKRIEKQLPKAKKLKWEGHNSYFINTTNDMSMLGNQMCKKLIECDVAVMFQIKFNREPYVTVSLRSIGDIDVSNIAKKYGGGGHKNASGFECSLRLFQSWFRNCSITC